VLILNPTIWYLADFGPISEILIEHVVKERKKMLSKSKFYKKKVLVSEDASIFFIMTSYAAG
jgi:hypothetical protein